MAIQREPFGQLPDGRNASIFTFSKENGMTVKITDFGGIIVSIETPDREGRLADVTLGFDTLAGYLKNTTYFGALIGRYGNRIQGADAERPRIPPAENDGNKRRRVDKVLWDSAIIRTAGRKLG